MISGGTDVHLVLVDLRNCELNGQQAEDRLAEIDITVNRNAVPFDPRPPMVTSGLRIGTPALATRGFGEAAFAEVADIIAEALIADAGADLSGLRSRVEALAAAHPLYPAWLTSPRDVACRTRRIRIRSSGHDHDAAACSVTSRPPAVVTSLAHAAGNRHPQRLPGRTLCRATLA